MAAGPEKSGHVIIAAAAAAFAFAALIAAPVLAAPESDLDCDENTVPALDVSATVLTATPVNNSEELLKSHLLKSRADSAVRAAFADEEAATDAEEEIAEEPVDAIATKPAVPSASDGEPSPYKRQMYRRDI